MKRFQILGLMGALSILSILTPAFSPAAEPTPYIPAASHLVVATPSSQWLNVSRALKPEDLRGKIVLLDFWTYACINCIHTLPEIAKLEKEFKDDLVVVGVHSAKFDTEKDTDQIRQAILRYEVEHAVVNDSDFRIWRHFEVRSWPTLVLLRPDGEIEKVFIGEGNTADIRKAVIALKAKNPKRSKTPLPIALEKDKVAKGELFYPSKVVYDESSKLVYVADSSHHQIAAYTWDIKSPENLKPAFRIGKSGTAGFANGSYASARFRRPQGLLVSKGILYIADTENHSIRKVDLKTKSVSTIAGNGKQGNTRTGKNFAATTSLVSPWDLAFHPDENHIVIAMAGSHQLWSLDLGARLLSVVAGTGEESIKDGLPGENTLSQPSAVSSLLGSLYFLDAETSSLRFFFRSYVRTLVGSGLFDFGFKDGDRKKALLQHPLGLYADVTGVFIADTYNHSIRRYDASEQTLETVIGDGTSGEGGEKGPEDAKKVRLNEPSGIAKLSDTSFLITDTNNHRLVLWNRSTGKVERMKIQGEEKVTRVRGGDTAEGAAAGAVVALKRFSIRLPNTIVMPDAKVNRTNPEVQIILPERYKLNLEAPSFVRLFEGTAPKEDMRQEWAKDDLQKSLKLKLSELSAGKKYILQGTVYYCLDTKNAICEIASFSFPVSVDASGSDQIPITIPMQPTVLKQ